MLPGFVPGEATGLVGKVVAAKAFKKVKTLRTDLNGLVTKCQSHHEEGDERYQMPKRHPVNCQNRLGLIKSLSYLWTHVRTYSYTVYWWELQARSMMMTQCRSRSSHHIVHCWVWLRLHVVSSPDFIVFLPLLAVITKLSVPVHSPFIRPRRWAQYAPRCLWLYPKAVHGLHRGLGQRGWLACSFWHVSLGCMCDSDQCSHLYLLLWEVRVQHASNGQPKTYFSSTRQRRIKTRHCGRDSIMNAPKLSELKFANVEVMDVEAVEMTTFFEVNGRRWWKAFI